MSLTAAGGVETAEQGRGSGGGECEEVAGWLYLGSVEEVGLDG